MEKLTCLLFHTGKKQGRLLLSLSFNIGVEGLDNTIKKEKEIEGGLEGKRNNGHYLQKQPTREYNS